MTADLFGFLTTEPNAEVGAVHPKAMPVILTTLEECDTWMSAPMSEALTLQRPLRDNALIVMARGENENPPAEKVAGDCCCNWHAISSDVYRRGAALTFNETLLPPLPHPSQSA